MGREPLESGHPELPGVMEGDYAEGRRDKLHLYYRYRVRAKLAVTAFKDCCPNVERPRLLEMGAADARTLLEMRRLLGGDGEYVGVELSDQLLDEVASHPDNVRLVRGNVMELPETLEAASFDLCTALAVIEHLPDPYACAAEAYRMLQKGGIFVATCPHPFWDEVARLFGMVEPDHHETEVTLEFLAELASRAGFRKVETRPFMWAPTGFLPYLGVDLDPQFSLGVDEVIRRLRWFDFTFVNQALIAEK